MDPGKSKRTRGRRSARQRGLEEDGAREIWLHNSSGRPQFLAAMAHASQLPTGRVVAIINQEHQCDGSSWRDAQAQAGGKGWRAFGANAVRTGGGGASAGVAIATQRGTNAGVEKKGDHDCAPPESKGRLAKLWVQDILPCGVTMLSVYMWHSEGHTDRNVRLLCRALEEARLSKGPWLLAGDFQQEPNDLLKWAAPLLEKVGGKVVCTEEPTNRPGTGTPARLDYFIVSPEIRQAVIGIQLITELGWEEEGERRAVEAKPHALVAMKLKSTAVQRHMDAIKTPRKFERKKPIGCARAPIWPIQEEGAEEEAEGGDKGEDTGAELDKDWEKIMGCVEEEICGICDHYKGREPDAKWCGRGGGD